MASTVYKADFSLAFLDAEGVPLRMEAVITGPDSVQRRVNIDIQARDRALPRNWPELATAEAEYQRGLAGQAADPASLPLPW